MYLRPSAWPAPIQSTAAVRRQVRKYWKCIFYTIRCHSYNATEESAFMEFLHQRNAKKFYHSRFLV